MSRIASRIYALLSSNPPVPGLEYDGEFWECTSGIGYFIPPKAPFFNARTWTLLVISAKLTDTTCTLPKFPKNVGLCF